VSVPCIFNPKNLQHEFSRHAPDFGVAGQWNTANGELFREAIQDHIAAAPQQISGTYRGTIPATHYYDPASSLWAAVDAANVFLAGWTLYPTQVVSLTNTGDVR